MRPAVLPLRIAATLLLLLGLLRAAGGAALLGRGFPVQPAVVSPRVAMGMGLGLLVVAAWAIVAALLLFGRRPAGFPWALGALGAFLLGGLVNGTLLFGHPNPGGTLVNLLAILAIGAFLLPGRRALA